MNLPDFDRLPDAVALDLDGTLFNSNEEISPRNRAALERCLEAGIPVILATSRPARLFHRVFPEELAERCSYTVMNGAVAAGNPPLSGYYKEPLPEDILHNAIDVSLKAYPDIGITLEIDGFEFGSNREADPETLWRRNSATPEMVLSVEEAIQKHPSKLALGGIGNEILPLMDILKSEMGDSISIVPALMWHPILNITCPGVNKASAISKLISPTGRTLENVVAFGDDLPDMDMLVECGIPVAMDNSLPEIKEACKYCTASNEDDGVAMVLERFLSL